MRVLTANCRIFQARGLASVLQKHAATAKLGWEVCPTPTGYTTAICQ
jgi:hypothetical protein